MTEKRRMARLPKRLRPGKILDGEGRFLGDCAILDRSPGGARVRLFGTPALPKDLALFDEGETLCWKAELVWRAGSLAGLGFLSPGERVDPADADRIAGRYYAVHR